MPDLKVKRTGEIKFVPPERLADALASGRYEAPSDGATVEVEVAPGLSGQTTVGDLPAAAAQGATPEREAVFRAREREARIDREHGGVGQKIISGAETVLNEASLGGTGLIGDLVGGEEYTENRLERAEASPIQTGVLKGATAVGTTLATGGVGTLGKIARATPLGQVAAIGNRIGKVADGASKTAKIGRTFLGNAVEGVGQGVGATIQQLTDSDDPLTWENATSALTSNALYAGAIGGGAGLAAKGIEKGLSKAKGMLDDVATRAAKADGVADDLSKLDRKGLSAAEAAERESLLTAQASEKAASVEGITAYRQAVKEANPWLVVTDGEASSLLTKSNSSLRAAMNDPVGLAQNPSTALKALRIQENALTKAMGEADAISAKLAASNKRIAKELGEEIATLPDSAGDVVLTGKQARRYGAYADVKVAKGGSVTVPRAKAVEFRDALDSGAVAGSEATAFQKLPDLLDANRALQQRIGAASVAKSELTSPRLAQIAEARDALTDTAIAGKSMPQQLLEGSIFGHATALAAPLGPLAPMIGARASKFIGSAVFGGLGKAGEAAAKKTAAGVAAFLDVARKVTPAAPVLATKVLGSVAFAPPKPAATRERKGTPVKEAGLAEVYKTRSDELRSQVSGGVMRQEARAALADRLKPIAAFAPILADRMETLAAKRLEFLASKLPRRPEIAALKTGPDKWQPSDMEMRTFARYAAAVEDPHAIVDRLADGSVTPEDSEAMRTVYPEMFADIQRQIIEQLPALQESLPYERRLALSIFSDVPVDASMDPDVLSVLQGSFVAEPNTEGGTQAPTPQPQFGSVKNQEATPFQERMGVTA
jgi:hypothetical protein